MPDLLSSILLWCHDSSKFADVEHVFLLAALMAGSRGTRKNAVSLCVVMNGLLAYQNLNWFVEASITVNYPGLSDACQHLFWCLKTVWTSIINQKHQVSTCLMAMFTVPDSAVSVFQTKLIKLFSRQVLAKQKCSECENASELKNYPKLVLWLKVVGLTPNSIQVCISQMIRRHTESCGVVLLPGIVITNVS